MVPFSQDSSQFEPEVRFAAGPRTNAAEPATAGEKEAWRILDVISRCVRASDDYQSCLEAILDLAMTVTSAEMGALRLLDPATGTLKIVVQQGLDEALLDAFGTLRQDEAMAYGLALRAGERFVVEDIALSDAIQVPGLAGTLLNAHVRAFQSTPMVATTGAFVGAVSTCYSHPYRPTTHQFGLLDLLTREAADYVERKQAEQALSSHSGLLESLLEHAPFAVCLVDAAFYIRHVNPEGLRMFGEATEKLPELSGRNFEDLMYGLWNREYAQAVVKRCRHTLLTGEPNSLTEERATRIGRAEMEFHEWRMHRIPLPDGTQGLVCYVRDVSPRVMARFKIHDQEEKLRRVVRLAAAGQIASSLAHEINNPLSAVTNSLYLLGEHAGLDPEARSLVSAAANELARVARIVRQSLSYYRRGTAMSELDMKALVEERLSAFSERIEAAGIQLVRKIAPEAQILGFAEEIRQVIDNLLVNALEATPVGGRLTVCLTRSRVWRNHNAPGIRLTVADTGAGIPREHLRRIFDPFFTTKPEGGRGLGLWVVRGIAAKYDGTLSIRSRQTEGRSGTVISIVWPLAIPAHAAARAEMRSDAGIGRPGAAA